MVWWLFKKKSKKQCTDFSQIHASLNKSFSNVKNDINTLHSHISGIKSKHNQHEEKISFIFNRLEAIEKHLGLSMVLPLSSAKEPEQEEGQFEAPSKEPKFPGIWESLTETERKICWKLSLLQREAPGQWLPLKYLASELYPEKEYSKIRSTLSQFIANLEQLGFVKRKRLGRQAYIFLIREKKQKVPPQSIPNKSNPD